MTPADFSREAGRVIHSPYWTDHPDTDDRRSIVAFSQKRHQELAVLKAALDYANSPDDLTPEARVIYERAKVAMMEWDKPPQADVVSQVIPTNEQEYLSKSLFPLTNRQNLDLYHQMLVDAINLDESNEILRMGQKLSPHEQAILAELQRKSKFRPSPGPSNPARP